MLFGYPASGAPQAAAGVTIPSEQIDTNEFMTEIEAKEWIAGKSAAWLKTYRGGRYA
jgi:hypothetical protein